MSEPKKRFKQSVAETPLVAEYCVSPPKDFAAGSKKTWNDLPPEDVSASGIEPVWWECRLFGNKCGHRWPATPNNRCKLGKGCPACAELKLSSRATEEVNLARLRPRVAKDFASDNEPSDPVKVHPGDRRDYHWICSVLDCGYDTYEPVFVRTGRKTYPCAECYARNTALARLDEKDSLLIRFPEVTKEWDPENPNTPDQIHHGSTKRAKWICAKCGHRWTSIIWSRTRGGHGCKKCGHQRATENVKDRSSRTT